jgi:hypothetical protein
MTDEERWVLQADDLVVRHLHAAKRQLVALQAEINRLEEQRLCTAGAVQALEKVRAELHRPAEQPATPEQAQARERGP